MEKGSTRMEENIEDLVRRISSSSMRTIVRHTWEFCKDYKEAGNFQDLSLLGTWSFLI